MIVNSYNPNVMIKFFKYIDRQPKLFYAIWFFFVIIFDILYLVFVKRDKPISLRILDILAGNLLGVILFLYIMYRLKRDL